MSEAFDPYLQWLDIPVGNRPPNHYDLLGLPLREGNPEAIARAADARMTQIRQVRPGGRLGDWGRLLDQVSSAKVCLLDPASKAAYDATLPAATGNVGSPPMSPPTAIATPPTMATPPGIDPPQSPGSQLPGSQFPESQLPQAPLPQSQLPQSQLPQSQLPQSQLPQGSGIPTAGTFDGQSVTEQASRVPFPVGYSQPTQPTADPTMATPPVTSNETPAPPNATPDSYKPNNTAPPTGVPWQATPTPAEAPLQSFNAPGTPPTMGYPPQTPVSGTPVPMAGIPMGGIPSGILMGVPAAAESEVYAGAMPATPGQSAEMAPSGGMSPQGTDATQTVSRTATAAKKPVNWALLRTLVLVAAFLGLAGAYVYKVKNQPPAVATVDNGQDDVGNVIPSPADTPAPRLPRAVQPPVVPQTSPPTSPPSDVSAQPPVKASEQQPSELQPEPRNEQNEPPASEPPAQSEPPHSQPPTTELVQGPTDGPTPADEPDEENAVVDASESKADPKKQATFAEAASNLRHAMAERELDLAQRHLDTVANLAQTPDEKAQVARLTRMTEYLNEFWNGIRGSLGNIESGSELQIGETRVAIVESTSNNLVIKSSGRLYDWDLFEIRRPVLLAIVDRTFPKDATTKAILGTFLAVDRGGKPEQRRQAKQYWNDAAQGGIRVEDLLPELAIDYGGDEGTAVPKAAPPSDPDHRKKIEQEVRETFARQFKAATTKPKQSKLAQELLDHAAKANDDADLRFVLLREARDLAIAAGNPELVGESIGQLAKHFNVDAEAMKLKALEHMVATATSTAAQRDLAQGTLQLCEQAVNDKQWKKATQLADLALVAARNSRNTPLMKKAAAAKQFIESLQKQPKKD